MTAPADDPGRTAPGEACWAPACDEREPVVGTQLWVGVRNALIFTAAVVLIVWTVVAFFEPDEFNPPVEIGEQP